MRIPPPSPVLSAKRFQLCSRENALRGRVPPDLRREQSGEHHPHRKPVTALSGIDRAGTRRSCRIADGVVMRIGQLGSVLAMLCVGAAPAAERPSFEARARALDGDTVAVDFRLLGVDAFERRQMCQRASGCWACGKAAQDLASNKLKSGEAVITLTRGQTYGRPVATVAIDGRDLGETMIRAGLAIPGAQYLRSDPARATRYQTAYRDAKVSKAGAFAGRWIAPSEWRKGARLTCER